MKRHRGDDTGLDRVHAALDGEIAVDALDSKERELYARMNAAVEESVSVLMDEPTPDLTSRVMAALPSDPASSRAAVSPLRNLFGWFWAPRPVSLSLRPAYGFMAAALLVLVWGIVRTQPEGLPPIAHDPATEEPTVLYVQFRVDVDQASRVAVAGSFTDWQPAVELTESAPGVWSALVPLEPGVHDYSFVVDGERWVTDPVAPEVEDGFGGTNSRLFLTEPLENA